MIRILTSLIALLAVTNLEAQQQMPKLVVYITVDQLRGDHLHHFYNTFGERGFKRLLNSGIVYNNVRFAFPNVGEANAFATLFTGTNPYKHGIAANELYDFEQGKTSSVLHDAEFLGNYTPENFSPRKLLSSTIADELKIASKGRSDVYSIAPNAEAALISAGHAANGAYWMDDYNGKWATTTYFKAMPWYVDRLNNGPEALIARLPSLEWTPSMPMANYRAFPYVMDEIPFKHTFKDRDTDCYFRLKTSPYINKEVNRLALRFIESAGFATRSCPDMLALTYFAGSYLPKKDQEYSLEIQDTYHQLDKDIEVLLDAIDKKIGLNKTLVVLTGTGYFNATEAYADGLNVHVGDFHPKRCVALLNMYLMATYGGEKNWVKGFYDNQLFLNRKSIEEAKLDLEAVQQKAADFIAEFSGVQQVITDFSLRRGEWNAETQSLYLGTHASMRGDLTLSLKPGWRVNNEVPGEEVHLVRHNAIQTPLIFMGAGLKPQRIHREVKATEVAPSVTHILRIRPPNACEELPLRELTY